MICLYLLDASVLYPLIVRMRERVMELSHLFSVLDLTRYEVGNVLWKEHGRGRIKDLGAAVEMFEEFFDEVEVRRAPEMEAVLRLAVEEGLTFYDASYLAAAREAEIVLVTEDEDLVRFPESINVEKLLKELGLREEGFGGSSD